MLLCDFLRQTGVVIWSVDCASFRWPTVHRRRVKSWSKLAALSRVVDNIAAPRVGSSAGAGMLASAGRGSGARTLSNARFKRMRNLQRGDTVPVRRPSPESYGFRFRRNFEIFVVNLGATADQSLPDRRMFILAYLENFLATWINEEGHIELIDNHRKHDPR